MKTNPLLNFNKLAFYHFKIFRIFAFWIQYLFMLPKINPTTLPEWKALENHYRNRNIHLRDCFLQDTHRFENFSITTPNFLFDFSKNLVNKETMTLLINLAKACELESCIKAYFGGQIINETEERAVFHTALRSTDPRFTVTGGKQMYAEIQQTLQKMKTFSQKVIHGEYKGYTGKKITDIVNIGIGGSDLGPKMATEALKDFSSGLRIHFVSNIDYSQIQSIFEKINPEQTLFIIASKTFTTQETMTNAHTAKNWFLNQGGTKKDIAQHFIAISCQPEEVEKFGIKAENRFEFWDWVGGRFSMWSAIGLSLMLGIGPENFEQLLRGAENIDIHFRETDFSQNIPVIMAMLGIWYRNFHHATTHAVLPYAQNLDLFPDYLQQADMESNGKSVDRNGEKVNYATGPILWGRAGTNGQHAFYQLIHQGTILVPSDFIGFVKSHHTESTHHEKLMANFFAQTEALAFGKTEREVCNESTNTKLIPHKIFEGNKPTNTLLFQELTPYTLGQLVAIYEHKIFVQGAIWNIFSFDQFGVELGKVLANTILDEIKNEKIGQHDSSTKGLINYYIQHKNQ